MQDQSLNRMLLGQSGSITTGKAAPHHPGGTIVPNTHIIAVKDSLTCASGHTPVPQSRMTPLSRKAPTGAPVLGGGLPLQLQ